MTWQTHPFKTSPRCAESNLDGITFTVACLYCTKVICGMQREKRLTVQIKYSRAQRSECCSEQKDSWQKQRVQTASRVDPGSRGGFCKCPLLPLSALYWRSESLRESVCTHTVYIMGDELLTPNLLNWKLKKDLDTLSMPRWADLHSLSNPLQTILSVQCVYLSTTLSFTMLVCTGCTVCFCASVMEEVLRFFT